jgi:AraC-like DNA-binding protein
MLTVARWSSPFEPQLEVGFVHLGEVRAQPGDVLLLRLVPSLEWVATGTDDVRVADTVRELRRRHPGSPVVLWIPEGPAQAVIDAARAAEQAQVRAMLGGPQPRPELLRAQLTHPRGLSSFILRWASDAGYLPPGLEQEDVRELLDAAPDVRTLGRLAHDRQVAARTWRLHLQQLGLPNPSAWLALAHALHVAFFVQRNHTDSVQALCEKLGMCTVANMSQQFKRVFGLPPSTVRDLLGAEPLLHRWFQSRSPRYGSGAPQGAAQAPPRAAAR